MPFVSATRAVFPMISDARLANVLPNSSTHIMACGWDTIAECTPASEEKDDPFIIIRAVNIITPSGDHFFKVSFSASRRAEYDDIHIRI